MAWNIALHYRWAGCQIFHGRIQKKRYTSLKDSKIWYLSIHQTHLGEKKKDELNNRHKQGRKEQFFSGYFTKNEKTSYEDKNCIKSEKHEKTIRIDIGWIIAQISRGEKPDFPD